MNERQDVSRFEFHRARMRASLDGNRDFLHVKLNPQIPATTLKFRRSVLVVSVVIYTESYFLMRIAKTQARVAQLYIASLCQFFTYHIM